MSGSTNYNVGSDTTLTVISNGVLLASAILTSFEARQITGDLKSVAIDGQNRYRFIEEGWEGTLEYDRADSTLDDYFTAKENGRYAGFQPPVVTITETNNEVDGTVTKYRYDGVTMKMDTAGRRTGDNKVEPKIGWKGSRRIKVL